MKVMILMSLSTLYVNFNFGGFKIRFQKQHHILQAQQ